MLDTRLVRSDREWRLIIIIKTPTNLYEYDCGRWVHKTIRYTKDV